jgi:hypothetical protein
MMTIGRPGLAAAIASAVAVFPAPGRAETTTFCVRQSSTMAVCSRDGMKDFFAVVMPLGMQSSAAVRVNVLVDVEVAYLRVGGSA